MQQIAPMEVGLPVIDLNRMLTFYCDVLGCQELRRADIAPELSALIKAAPDGYVNVWLQFPGGEVVKLMRPPQVPAAVATAEYYSQRTGFAYLTFYCSNLEDTLAAALAQGAALLSDRATLSGDVGVKIAFFSDPEGNVIELVEPV